MLEQLHSSRHVCSNCYRRVRRRTEQNFVFDRSYPGNARPAPSSIPETSFRRNQSDTNRVAATMPPPTVGKYKTYNDGEIEMNGGDGSPTFGMKTICECGHFSPFEQDRPLDANQLENHLKRVLDRLEEFGYVVDRDEVLRQANSIKRDPSNDREDNDIMQSALNNA